MNFTWDEFQSVAPLLDEVTQLKIMAAVLAWRVQQLEEANQRLIDRLVDKDHTIARLEEDVRETNGAHA